MVKAERSHDWRLKLRKREALGGRRTRISRRGCLWRASNKNKLLFPGGGGWGGAGSSCHSADHMTQSILSQWKEIINAGFQLHRPTRTRAASLTASANCIR